MNDICNIVGFEQVDNLKFIWVCHCFMGELESKPLSLLWTK